MNEINKENETENVKIFGDTNTDRIEILVAKKGYAWAGASMTHSQADLVFEALKQYKDQLKG
jgi:hypothetical protein